MLELRSNLDKKPIIVQTIEELERIAYFTYIKHGVNVFIKYPDIDDHFQYVPSPCTDTLTDKELVDVIILGKDLAMLEKSLDYSELFKPIFAENEKLVEQYKTGNEKALNALLGKFLKDNKGVDPKEVKENLIKLLS